MSYSQPINEATPWLSDAEIADLCAGLKQAAAQTKYLQRLGLAVRLKPNGRPLVFRADLAALSGQNAKKPLKREPNRLALINMGGAK